MNEPQACQCEHVAHWHDRAFRFTTPNGHPGHARGARFLPSLLRDVETAYGTYRVCSDCAEDCLAGYNIETDRPAPVTPTVCKEPVDVTRSMPDASETAAIAARHVMVAERSYHEAMQDIGTTLADAYACDPYMNQSFRQWCIEAEIPEAAEAMVRLIAAHKAWREATNGYLALVSPARDGAER